MSTKLRTRRRTNEYGGQAAQRLMGCRGRRLLLREDGTYAFTFAILPTHIFVLTDVVTCMPYTDRTLKRLPCEVTLARSPVASNVSTGLERYGNFCVQ